MRETASKSALLLSPCLRWAHPAAKWYQDREDNSKPREDGKIIHHALHLAANDLPYAIPTDVELKIASGINFLEKLKTRSEWIQSEKAFGVDFIKNEVKSVSIEDRNYPTDDNFFYGTADIVAKLLNGSILVADYKSGNAGADGAEEQLKTLAIAAHRIYGTPGEETLNQIRIASVVLSDNGEYYSNEREVSKAELQEHYNTMASALLRSRAEHKPPAPNPGPYCTTLYCPHLANCPSTSSDSERLVREAGNKAFEGEVPDSVFTEVPGNLIEAGMLASRLKAIQRAHKYYEGHLKDWIRKGNRAIWNGYEYKETGRGFMLVKNK